MSIQEQLLKVVPIPEGCFVRVSLVSIELLQLLHERSRQIGVGDNKQSVGVMRAEEVYDIDDLSVPDTPS